MDDASGGYATRARSRLSYIVQHQQTPTGRRAVIPVDLRTWQLDEDLPSPAEQLDNLVLMIGAAQTTSDEWANLSLEAVSAWIGAAINTAHSRAAVSWLLEKGKPTGLIERGANTSGLLRARLTFHGWEKYAALKRGRVESRVALMAMQFNDAQMDNVLMDCFAPAVRLAGFDLRTIAQRQPAGLIDDQLRVALRRSRFVVADITHENRGAFWEAGFAEGVGRPVIYTCREDSWDKGASHFDTNHLVTIVWRPDELEKAGRQLAATIRATLPDEAIMDDP
jgi:hypothetical protein